MSKDLAEPSAAPTTLAKTLGNWDALALGFGAMIGFGWVVLTGGWLDNAGTMGAVCAMLAGGAIMAIVGLTYAELTAAMPKAGGEHN
ncbi:amino acid permease, partial [Glutamicibacter ardleyensis]